MAVFDLRKVSKASSFGVSEEKTVNKLASLSREGDHLWWWKE
jgi:hypothetical protein